MARATPPKKWNVSTGTGTSLAVQWLGLHASIAGDPGSILGWGIKISQVSRCGKKKKKHRDTSLFLTHTHRCWCAQRTTMKAAGLPLARSQDRTLWAGPSLLSQLPETLPSRKGCREVLTWEATAPRFEYAHLCVSAIFSLSFSDLRCVLAGPAQDAFSSSVPLVLDAWVEDGVSHPDSWPDWITCTPCRLSSQRKQIRHNEELCGYECGRTNTSNQNAAKTDKSTD